MGRGIRWLAVAMLWLYCACSDGRRTAPLPVSLEITPSLPQIAMGTAVQFRATARFADGSLADVTEQVQWSNDDAAVATVDSGGIASGLQMGTTMVRAEHVPAGVHDRMQLIVTAARLVSIAVTPPTPQIANGTTQQFAATGTFTDLTTQDLTAQVNWSSAAGGIATVGGTGLATGHAVGSTTITALHGGSGISGSAPLVVSAAVLVGLTVTPPTSSIALGTGRQFTATGTFSDSTTQDMSALVTWSSSATGVATVSNAGGSEGLADSVAVGSAAITATHVATSIADSAALTVTAAELVSIAVTPTNPSIADGTTQQFTATGTWTDSTTQDLTDSVAWTSSQTTTATISNAGGSEGLATALAIGATTITATDPGTSIAGTTTLTVTAAELVSIAVTPTNPSIADGTTQQFTATGTWTDSTTQDLTDGVTWSSSSTATASISNAGGSEGLATAISIGATTITATDPGTSIAGTTTLTVTAAELVSIAVTPASPSIADGTTQQFTATGTWTDNSTQDLTDSVTWTSSSTATATISNAGGSEGLATAIAVGATTITATDPGTSIAGTTTLTVTAAELVSIAVTPANPSVALGVDPQFTATGTYTDSSTQDLTDDVTWSSSQTATATISNAGGSEGLATTLAVGSTTITATDPGTSIAGTTTLTVTPAVLQSITVTPNPSTVFTGETRQFTATGTWTDSSTADLTTAVTWSSSATGAATISNAGGSEGLATGVAAGSTTITALDPGTLIQGTAALTVLDDIALRSVSSNGADSGVQTLSLGKPSGTTAGDLLVASVALRPSTASITPPSGWTLLRRIDTGTGAANSQAVYWRVATASEPTSYNFTFSASTGSAGGIAAFTGVDTTTPFDVENGQSTASSLSHATPDVTSTTNGCMLVTVHSFSSAATWTPPAGMTAALQRMSVASENSVGVSLLVSTELQATAGATGARTATASANADTGCAAIMALRRAP